MAGNEQVGFDLVKACKEACAAANVLLKVIIETGELKDEALIRKASEIPIKAGADFIKTSTGKVAVNATPESARIMMEVIRDMGVEKTVGFKPAGGVRTAEDAQKYLAIADELFGADWADARHYRFGASSLLASLLKALGHGDGQRQQLLRLDLPDDAAMLIRFPITSSLFHGRLPCFSHKKLFVKNVMVMR